MTKGRITIPTDESFVEGTRKVAQLWGADAVRDCDGTCLPDNPGQFGKVYNTYFIVRGDNEWGRKHPEETHRTFLMSERVTATTDSVEISVVKGFLPEQIVPDYDNITYWQVFDRTTNREVKEFDVDRKNGKVTVHNAIEFHEYTVNFMAKVTWHPVQIYNYLTNNWTCEKQLMYDPAFPHTREYIKEFMVKWCEEHPETNVVRFTTFLYQFSLIFNEEGKEKYVDWFGYTLACSPEALRDFEKEYGYALSSEDIVDNGYYNNPFRLPKKKFQDFMDFTQRRVAATVKELVEIVHSYGKEAMMFLGDDWIGAEPYGEYFGDMNLDAVVGSVGGGVTVRMLSEIPHVKYTEGRFLPYFFPDTFFDGNEENAVAELNKNWQTARRAIMRKPIDRMGYGGYLSLAAKFPTFIDRVTEICNEFRTIYDAIDNKKPYCRMTVGILNAWGKIRSWQSHMVAHELWYQQIYSYQGVLESLSGLPVDVKFLSFDDIRKGVPEAIDVLINVGSAYTAFSGGEAWMDEQLTTAVRKFVHNGGGFVGIGEPTACQHGGRYFQLADVLGVDKEVGYSLSEDKYNIKQVKHELMQDMDNIDYGEDMKDIYALPNTQVLDIKFSDRFKRNVNVGEVKMAVNNYGKGKSFYMTGLPYSFENCRLLYKALCYVAGKELNICYSTNVATDCNYYPHTGKYAIVNNSNAIQKTTFHDVNGKAQELELMPLEIKWL